MPNWQVPAKSLGMYKKKSYFQVAVFAKAAFKLTFEGVGYVYATNSTLLRYLCTLLLRIENSKNEKIRPTKP
jgi:hypothetical protein